MAGSQSSKRRMPNGSNSLLAGSEAIPGVFQELLADAVSLSPTPFNEEGKTVKRRRIGGRVISRYNGDKSGNETEHSTGPVQDSDTGKATPEKVVAGRQTTYNDSDDSMDSDMDWEEVDLVKDGAEQDVDDEEKALDLVIGGKELGGAKHHTPRRKADSVVEKKMRLEVHKTHLLCLLAYVRLRNQWCEDVQVQVG